MPPDPIDLLATTALATLKVRLEEAVRNLSPGKAPAAGSFDGLEWSRKGGKQQGVKLALSYVDEMMRELS